MTNKANSQHTPGPWFAKPSVHGNEYAYIQIGADETYTTLEVLPADARLIAAAPDMLAALKLVEKEFSTGRVQRGLTQKVRAAIAKATAAAFTESA